MLVNMWLAMVHVTLILRLGLYLNSAYDIRLGYLLIVLLKRFNGVFSRAI